MSNFYSPEAINVRIASEDEVDLTSPLPKRRRIARLEPSRDAFLSHGSWVHQDQSHLPVEIDDSDLVQFNELEADVTARHVLGGFDDGARLDKNPPCYKDTLTGTHQMEQIFRN